jgi:hypothetical protein
MTGLFILLGTLLLWGICLFGPAQSQATPEGAAIIMVLPPDAIPAILQPTFVPASQARVAPDAAMIGVVIEHDARAYSAWLLNAHEIVNDVVGGEAIATTW